jgi:hypothetical protein
MEGIATAVWMAKAAPTDGMRVLNQVSRNQASTGGRCLKYLRKGLRKLVRCKRELTRVILPGIFQIDEDPRVMMTLRGSVFVYVSRGQTYAALRPPAGFS